MGFADPVFRFFFCLGHAGFNSLQTGKCIARKIAASHANTRSSFQFPSNGKVYGKPEGWEYVGKLDNLFQFPSNGKAYGKEVPPGISVPRVEVSIPFKREDVWQVAIVGWILHQRAKSFNSVQTGRCMARVPILHPVVTWASTPRNQTRTARCFF